MKSDHELYALFQTNPDFLRDVLDLKVEDGYTFHSENFKTLERQLDGVYQKDGCPDVWLVEFQGYPPGKNSKDVYTSTIAGMSAFQLQYPNKIANGVIVFLSPRFDPKTQPWYQIVAASLPLFKVYYLQEILDALAIRDPNHLLLDIFFP